MIHTSLFIIAALLAADPALGSDLPRYGDQRNLLVYRGADGALHPVDSTQTSAHRAGHLRIHMQQVMGELPARDSLSPPTATMVSEEDMGTHTRKKMLLEVEPDDQLPVYVLMPKTIGGKAPAVLALHPTSVHGKGQVLGLGDRPNRNYGEELAERGYVVLAPDYPGFGDYVIDVYAMGWVSATAKGIWNHMRCVDFLETLPEVDPERIGAIGHSLGGHNTLFLGVFDERVCALVTSCGFTRFARYYNGDLTGWTHKGYMPRIASVYDKDPERMPFDFPEILGALAPRHVFISAPRRDDNFDVTGVRECVEAAAPIYELHGVPERLKAIYPDCAHDFPPDIREAAYTFLDDAFR